MDWSDWHRRYESSPSLSARLRIVCKELAAAIEETPAGPVRILSLCAGDGRDVIGALRHHPRRHDVTAWLLDTHEESLARGAKASVAAGLERQIRFVQADAGLAANYSGIAPADVVLISGFLGHIRQRDLPGLFASLPMLCRRGASVIWNKHRVANDGPAAVRAICGWLADAGFVESHFEITDEDGYAVGRARFRGRPLELDPGRVLFEFDKERAV